MSLLVLIGTFSDAFIYITFKLNQDKIAEELCINLDEPELMCKGKCFLDDQLARINTSQPQKVGQTPVKFEKKDIPLYYKSNKSEKINLSCFLTPQWQPNETQVASYEIHLEGVFHPPKV